MSETKWTKGPWAVGDLYTPIVSVMHVSVRADDGFIVAAVNRFAASFNDKRDTANANLIAAAPELYEALDEMLARFAPNDVIEDLKAGKGYGYRIYPPERHFTDADIIRFRAALGKARGE